MFLIFVPCPQNRRIRRIRSPYFSQNTLCNRFLKNITIFQYRYTGQSGTRFQNNAHSVVLFITITIHRLEYRLTSTGHPLSRQPVRKSTAGPPGVPRGPADFPHNHWRVMQIGRFRSGRSILHSESQTYCVRAAATALPACRQTAHGRTDRRRTPANRPLFPRARQI